MDLTQPLHAGIPVTPGGDPFARDVLGTVQETGAYWARFHMGEHTGTHVDAPAHFQAGGVSVDALLPSAFISRAAVVDVRPAVRSDPAYEATEEDIRRWEAEHGTLDSTYVVLIHTGWGERWDDPESYLNRDAAGELRFPGVSVEASRYLRERSVSGLGIDSLSTEPRSTRLFEQHRAFLKDQAFHIENLKNLHLLPPVGAVVIVAPLPIVNGSGAPARVYALLPERIDGPGGAK